MKLSKQAPEASAKEIASEVVVDEQTLASSKKPLGPVLLGATLGAFLGLAIAVVIGFFIYQEQVANERQRQLNAETQQRAVWLQSGLSVS